MNLKKIFERFTGRRRNMPGKIRTALLIIFALIFLFSLYNIGKKAYGYYADNKRYEDIRASLPSGGAYPAQPAGTAPTAGIAASKAGTAGVQQSPSTGSPASSATQLPYRIEQGSAAELDRDGVLSRYSGLRAQNKDFMGWVSMPGFEKPLDYPVMQGKDDQYYLDKDFYGNYSYAGSIFMDIRNNPSRVERHIIIYGHAMNDLSMFGNLKEFANKPEDYRKNTRIYLDLLNTRLVYEVFSTYLEHESYNYRQTEFADDAEYLAFLQRLASKSVYDYKANLTAKDRILTLSTCNRNLLWDGRSIVHARLIRQTVYQPEAGLQEEAAGEAQTASGPAPGTETVSQITAAEAVSQASPAEAGAVTQSPAVEAVSANVYLLQLSMTLVQGDSQVGLPFEPAFNTKYKEFSVLIPPGVENAMLQVRTADPEAEVFATYDGKEISLVDSAEDKGEGGKTAPAAGKAAPADGKAAPADGKAAPADGKAAPGDGEAAPAAGSLLKTGEIQLNPGESTIKLKVVSRDKQYSRTYTITVKSQQADLNLPAE